MADNLYELIVTVNEEGFNGLTDGMEKLEQFVQENDGFDSSDLYNAVKEDMGDVPDDYLEAVKDGGVLDQIIDKVEDADDELELTYEEGVIMGLWSILDVLHEVKENPILQMIMGYDGAVREKIEAVYRDRTEAELV